MTEVREGERGDNRDAPSTGKYGAQGHLDVCLKVVALDAAEDLPQAPCLDHVVHELDGQPLTQVNHLHWSPGNHLRS